MNNIKVLPGCFRGSRQLGQTIVYFNYHTSIIYNNSIRTRGVRTMLIY